MNIDKLTPRDHVAELEALRIERIAADFAELTPEARAKVLQTLTNFR